MYIFINKNRIYLSDDYVNKYRNDAANCPLCKDDEIKICPFGHQKSPTAAELAARAAFNAEWNIRYDDDDDIGRAFGQFVGFGENRRRRSTDNKVAAVRLKLKKLGINKTDIEEIVFWGGK